MEALLTPQALAVVGSMHGLNDESLLRVVFVLIQLVHLQTGLSLALSVHTGCLYSRGRVVLAICQPAMMCNS